MWEAIATFISVNKKAIVAFLVFLVLRAISLTGVIASESFSAELSTVLEGLVLALSVWFTRNGGRAV